MSLVLIIKALFEVISLCLSLWNKRPKESREDLESFIVFMRETRLTFDTLKQAETPEEKQDAAKKLANILNYL